MSNLIFIPPAATSNSAQDLKNPSFSGKTSGTSSFEQLLKDVSEKKVRIAQYQEKTGRFRSDEPKVKPAPKANEFKTVDCSRQSKVEAQSKPQREAVGGDTARSQAADTDEKEVAATISDVEDQKTEKATDVNQEEIIVLLAHLAEAEAVIRGETLPETIQTVEIAEVMVEPELVAAIQGRDLPVEPVKQGVVKMAETGIDTQDTQPTESKLVAEDAGLNVTIIKSNSEAGAINPNQVGQIMPQSLGNASNQAGDFNQEKHSGGKSRLSESGKVSFTNLEIKDESQKFSKIMFDEDLSQDVGTQTQQGEKRVVAEPDLTSASNGKVNLAVLQTQLAVNDGPEVEFEFQGLNVTPGQPSLGNVAPIQTSGSTEVASANREELFSQIVERAKVVINNGGNKMEVNLKPEHLGRLQLKVTIENEVVTARFVAESQQVKEIIESNLGQLKQNLQENGMQVDSILVSVGNQPGNDGFEQATYNRESNSFSGPARTQSDDLTPENMERTPLAERDTVINLIA